MKTFIKVDENGFPSAFYDERLLGMRHVPIYGDLPEATDENPYPVAKIIGYEDNPDCKIPADAVEISPEQYAEMIENSGLRKFMDGKVVEYAPEAAEALIILPAVTLWERMTDDEAEQVNAAMAAQPVRARQIFLTANTFRSDHELWPQLQHIAADLFGTERAAELLAAPLF